MGQISAKKLREHKPLIVHRLAKQAWGDGEKGLLSKALFEDMIEDVRNSLSRKIRGLPQEELVAR